MTDLLEQIAKATRRRIQRDKNAVSQEEMIQADKARERGTFPFEEALKKQGMSFICEVKKASPSKGVIHEGFPYLEIAGEYQEAGADAISVLTEPEYFQGADRYLSEIREQVKIPVLRKDFILDPYQIHQAKVLGADAVLLICSLLDDADLKEFLTLCHVLGLSALVETHTKEEVARAVIAGAGIIGVNNRNLRDFQVDLSNTAEVAHLVPPGILLVSESGIKSPEDVAFLGACGVDGVLIGESLMKSGDRGGTLETFRTASYPIPGKRAGGNRGKRP